MASIFFVISMKIEKELNDMRYYLLLLITSLLWGGNFIVGKTLTNHASPTTLTSLRWMIAIALLAPIVFLTEKKLFPHKKAIIPSIFMGVTGVVLFQILQFMSLAKTSAINVGLISTLNMLSIAIFSFLFLKEKINVLQLFSMILSIFGVILVLSKGNLHFIFSLQFNIGDLYMLGAVGVWGLYSVCSKWAMQTISPMMSTLYSGIFGLLVLLPFNISSFRVIQMDSSFIKSILYTGIISTVVCMVLWNVGVQKLGTNTSGLFLNFNPIFTSILAFIILGEEMSWVQGIGSIIVISGCYLFSYFKTKTVFNAVSSESEIQT